MPLVAKPRRLLFHWFILLTILGSEVPRIGGWMQHWVVKFLELKLVLEVKASTPLVNQITSPSCLIV